MVFIFASNIFAATLLYKNEYSSYCIRIRW